MSAPWCERLSEYELVAESDERRVVFCANLEREYKRIEKKDKASLARWMQIWCEKSGAIQDTRLKAQERVNGPRGDSVLIWAFKSYQARLYGFIHSAEGKETFFVTEVDPKKKDDKANPRSLKRAADEAFRVLGVLAVK